MNFLKLSHLSILLFKFKQISIVFVTVFTAVFMTLSAQKKSKKKKQRPFQRGDEKR